MRRTSSTRGRRLNIAGERSPQASPAAPHRREIRPPSRRRRGYSRTPEAAALGRAGSGEERRSARRTGCDPGEDARRGRPGGHDLPWGLPIRRLSRGRGWRAPIQGRRHDRAGARAPASLAADGARSRGRPDRRRLGPGPCPGGGQEPAARPPAGLLRSRRDRDQRSWSTRQRGSARDRSGSPIRERTPCCSARFWVQLACGVTLMVVGPLLAAAARERGARRSRRAKRRSRRADPARSRARPVTSLKPRERRRERSPTGAPEAKRGARARPAVRLHRLRIGPAGLGVHDHLPARLRARTGGAPSAASRPPTATTTRWP